MLFVIKIAVAFVLISFNRHGIDFTRYSAVATDYNCSHKMRSFLEKGQSNNTEVTA